MNGNVSELCLTSPEGLPPKDKKRETYPDWCYRGGNWTTDPIPVTEREDVGIEGAYAETGLRLVLGAPIAEKDTRTDIFRYFPPSILKNIKKEKLVLACPKYEEVQE